MALGIRSVHVLVVVILGAVGFAAVVLPGLLTSGRASNDRSSEALLKILSCAEYDFRSNDRDWNHVNDFWTGDVKGLYTMTSSAVEGHADPKADPSIRLISREAAAADIDPDLVPAGGENRPLDADLVPSPYRGYWMGALSKDSSASEPSYKQDTGGTSEMGKCHHLSRFGFVAIPDSLSAFWLVMIVNEQDTIYRCAATSNPKPGMSVPPGLKGVDPIYLNWPEASVLKAAWSKVR